ncbi:MAG: hypothetical protein ACXABY_04990 [Candidatus Thorarchaeota archaeon]|jgi:hypothetical protein
MLNVSIENDTNTANTRSIVGQRRAENLAILGAKNVIELCVGPSLRVLEQAYSLHDIKVTGNDIEERWQKHYPKGSWIIGDALTIPLTGFDAAVFAPPLSHGCTGRREDALSIDAVFPSYRQFLARENLPGIFVLVLPGRSFSTRADRTQLHALASFIQAQGHSFDVIPMKDERNRITKYVDIYVSGQ